MKVLALTQIFPSEQEVTRGPYNFNIFRALSEQCEVQVVSPQPWWTRVRRPQTLLRVPHETRSGLEAFYPTYWSAPRMTALHARAMHTSLRPYLTRLRKTFPFDVILAAWAYPDAAAAARLAEDFGCPLVTKILGSDINTLPSLPGLRNQVVRGLSRSQRVVTVSGALRDRVMELGIPGERVVVRHNGVDGNRFTLGDRGEARRRLGLPLDRSLLCYVGRLGHEKGVDILIEALSHLRRSRNDFEMLLVGHGEMEGSLRARVTALGLEDHVRFCGMREHTEIPQWISACDVFCLPSRREGCPNVVLEALASGRPVVASRVGGVPELLTEGNGQEANGIMIPSEDPTALAAALAQALARPWDAQALRDSVECLSWEEVGHTYHRLLVEAVDEWKVRPQAAGLSAPLESASLCP